MPHKRLADERGAVKQGDVVDRRQEVDGQPGLGEATRRPPPAHLWVDEYRQWTWDGMRRKSSLSAAARRRWLSHCALRSVAQDRLKQRVFSFPFFFLRQCSTLEEKDNE